MPVLGGNGGGAAQLVSDTWPYAFAGLAGETPPSTGWTDLNTSVLTVEASGDLVMTLPAAAGVGYEGSRRNSPVAAGNAWYALVRLLPTGGSGEIGCGWYETSTGKLVTCTLVSGGNINIQKYTNRTTFAANYHAPLVTERYLAEGLWLGFEDDGTTNRSIYMGTNRIGWQLVEQHSRIDHLTADAFWLGGYTNTTLTAQQLRIPDFAIGAGSLPTAHP